MKFAAEGFEKIFRIFIPAFTCDLVNIQVRVGEERQRLIKMRFVSRVPPGKLLLCGNADLDFGAFSGFTRIEETVFFSVKNLDSAVGIVDTDVGTAGCAAAGAEKETGKLLFVHTDAVVRDEQYDVVIFDPTGKDNCTGFAFFFEDSVQHGILHDRLKRELGNLILHEFIGDI